MNTDSKILWTRVDGIKSQRDTLLIGQIIDRNWLSGSVSLTNIHFSGGMKIAFCDLIEAAKEQKLNLPIVSLRLALSSDIDSVIFLDKNLGLQADHQGIMSAAIQMYSPPEENLPELREKLAYIIRRWLTDDVETWAERNNLGHIAERLRNEVSPTGFVLDPADIAYIDVKRRPNYPLIAREFGERLVGEELFEGMGQCELVSSLDNNTNTVELMTKPRRSEGRYRDDFYSMVARLSVTSMPYSNDLYLSVSAMKRVWAKRMPALHYRTNGSVTAYVMGSGRPVSRVTVNKTKDGWVFGDEYATLQRKSGNQLPHTIADAISRREFNDVTGWWAGLPELPSLFTSISPRTVFESDELALLETASRLVAPLLAAGNIPVREVKLPTLPAKPLQEMIRLSDFGMAGGVFNQIGDEEDEEDVGEEIEEDSSFRKAELELYRTQNMLALHQVHGDMKPIIWLLSDYQMEKGLIQKTIEVLFGDAVTVYDEPLPPKTHGLRSNLERPEGKARQRFDIRVKCWEKTAKQIKEQSGERQIVVLICASDRIGSTPEDPVNYFAGIHALSSIGANVHHVLPIENRDEQSSQQNFIHRVQSALLDVMLAHSGAVFGVKDFVDRLPTLGGAAPLGIYGIQAVRSRAQSRSGQTGVSFILFSRIQVANGHTHVRVGYRDGSNKLTEWMPLSKALSWIGSQRRLQEGDDNWLRAAFEPLTREALAMIHAEDAKAVVMIQWDSVRSLWRGISDTELNSGAPPKLGDLPLLRFKGMTFIRIRNSNDTLPLRTLVKSSFRGWIDGAPTGEVHQENYATTERRLVEVSKSPEHAEHAYGHFIASMGYIKTVQVKRGLSCYRSMPRMSRIGKGTQEFELKSFDIASMDASLPAPMDLTVMTVPDGIAPGVYAILAMGLRLGYAHHNDWTRLPMPLFFRAKIEDYVIRYPEDEDEAVITLTDERESSNSTGTVMSDKVIKAVKGEETEETHPPSEEEAVFDFKLAVDADDLDELVQLVRGTDMPAIMDHLNDYQIRLLYHKMFNGEANVSVELPYWVKVQGIFLVTGDVTKRNVRRCWNWLYEFGYVRQHGNHMPHPERFIDWLAAKLRIPQVCHAIIGATREIGSLTFTELAHLIETEYNTDNPDEMVNPFRIKNEEFESMLIWASTHRHDALLGWLIFMAVQLPKQSWIKAIREKLSIMPGPRTEHALQYYLETASTISSVLEQKGKSVKLNIHRLLPKVKTPEPATTEKISAKVFITEGAFRDSNPELDKTTDQESARIMSTKKTLIELIEAIEPGSKDFSDIIGSIHEQIDVLQHIHSDRVALSKAAEAIEAKLGEFKAYQADVAARVNIMSEQLDMPHVDAREITADKLDIAQSQLSEIDSIVGNLESLLSMLDGLESSPKPTSLQERAKRRELSQNVEENAVAQSDELRHVLKNSICFILTEQGGPDTPPEPTGTRPKYMDFDCDHVDLLSDSLMHDPVSTELGPAEPIQISSPEQEPSPKQVDVSPKGTEPEFVITPAVDEPHIPETVSQEAYSNETVLVQEQFEGSESTPGKYKVNTFETNIAALHQLFDQRLYGLADCQVAALGILTKDIGSSELELHQAILQSLVQSMNAMDCEFSFDTKLDPQLSNLLTASTLPCGAIADPEYMALGILAAGLGNMLFDSTEVQWKIGNAISARLSGRPGFDNLVNHLDVIRQHGLMLTRDLFLRSRIGDKVAIENEILRMQKRADNWKGNPELHRNFHNYAFKSAHAHMFGESTAIGKCLLLIYRGDHSRLIHAYEDAKPKFKRPMQTIEESFKQVNERVRAEGTYRQMMIDNILAAEKFITTYMELVRQKDSHVTGLTRDVQSFLDGLRERLNEALKEARALRPVKEIEKLYRNAAIKAFRCVIQLFDAFEPAAYIPEAKQRLLLQVSLGKDLRPALESPDPMTPPVCSPEQVFKEICDFANDQIKLDEPGSESDINRALADAYQGHITAKRFLPAFLIANQLPSSLIPKGPTLEQQYHHERDKFSDDLQDARQRVAHAMTLNALPSNEATRMQWLIEELLTLCQRNEHSISRPDVSSSAYPDFPQALASLRCNVLQPLEKHLRESQEKLESKLDNIEATGMVSATDIRRIREMVEGGNAATLLTAYDALNMLEQSGKLPIRLGNSAVDLGEEYEKYIKSLKESTGRNKHLLDEIVNRLSVEPNADDPLWLAALDEAHRKDAKTFIENWLEFFKVRTPHNTALSERLFQSMGFSAIPTFFPENGRAHRARFTLDRDTFRFLTTTADDSLFIPPILGSSASYNLCVALYGTPQENDIRQALAEIVNVPTILMARTQYDMLKRSQVTYSHPVLYIDDDLIAYAAVHPGGRLANILKVCMLTFTTNPYDDYQTKPVPSEMFFGRQKELEMLHSVKGLAVLYGGRRLGKSSLLAQVELETNSKPGESAVYISMYNADYSGDYVTSAWEKIYEALVNRNLIEPIVGMLPNQWKPIQQHIQKQLLNSNKRTSLYLLIDEADDVMRRELHRRPDEESFVRTLTQLTDDLGHACHVRIVIAGLHNMTRMADDVNSVFGKTAPIALKPFTGVDEVQRGLRLITKPLAAMGYLFQQGNEDLAMRIMAVCNYYPAFIQLYCKHLVEHLQNKRQDKQPPCYIEANDLNNVEKDNSLLSELRDKFALNLKLDKRYKAIALILADAYYTGVDKGIYTGMTTSEIREHCEAFCPTHFANSSTGVYEALLDEMCKLNVIERSGTQYLLRNPNIAMMVGDRDRVSTLLSGLGSEPPETSRNQGERRVKMTLNSSRDIEFPMPMSWIRNYLNNTSDGQLLILTGNAASGLSDLAGIGRDEEWKLPGGLYMTAPASQPSHLSQLIDRERRTSNQNKLPKFLAIQPSRWKISDIADYATIAQKAGKHGLRILLLALPERALEIAMAIESKTLRVPPLSEQAWRVVPIPPWTEDAIHFHPTIHENIKIADQPEALTAIRTATCGFGSYVLSLCTPNLTLEKALAAPKSTSDRVANDAQAFHQAIGMPPSLYGERLNQIVEFLSLINSMGLGRSNYAEREECMAVYSISEPMWDFLYWMGLIQEGSGNTWAVPTLYANLLGR